MSTVASNLADVLRRIEKAASKAGRDPASVELVAVSKTVGVDKAMEALAAGAVSLGESRVQEARKKFEVIGRRARWHMIGPLQTNKARYCPGLFTLIHSVDRLELARELDRRAGQSGEAMECLVQVNVSGEGQKSGCEPEEAATLVKETSKLANLRFTGLMTIPPYSDDPEDSRPFFRELARLAAELTGMGIAGVSFENLSMGMTGDFEVAIEEGATIVRVGSGIFGERVYN